MINRGVTQSSQYVYNSKTKKLEKKEKNIQTIESLSKQARKQVYDLSSIGIEVNKANEVPKPVNQITVITGDDNLIHNYFFDFVYSWDIKNCLSIATIKMPKMDEENIKYWTTYQGPITVYGGHDFTLDKVNNQGFQEEQDAANSLAQYSDISDIKPLFRGTANRIKQFDTHIELYVNSIGERFKQEIPDDFRQMYINNQNVADAFQAICEFIGVQYICPPKKQNETTADTGNSNNNEGDGTENDVTDQQQTTQQIVDTVKNKVKQKNEQVESQTNQDNQQENTNNNEITNNQEIEQTINGYDDISFDANGFIVHGSTVIETSPDMADTLIQMEENPLERYLEDENGVIEKVRKFLDGDMFEEIHSNVLDYGAITVQPASTTSSDISTSNVGDTNVSDLSNGDTNSSSSSSSSSSGSSSGSSFKINASTGVKAQATQPKVLSKAYINSLSPERAKQLRINGSGKYTKDTLQKLLWRSIGMILT